MIQVNFLVVAIMATSVAALLFAPIVYGAYNESKKRRELKKSYMYKLKVRR